MDGFNGMTIGEILFYSHASFVASVPAFLRGQTAHTELQNHHLKSATVLLFQMFSTKLGLSILEDEVPQPLAK